MSRQVNSAEVFKVYSQQFAVENTNNSTPSLQISIDGEHFYDTSYEIAANDITLVYIGGPQLFFRIGSTDIGEIYNIAG